MKDTFTTEDMLNFAQYILSPQRVEQIAKTPYYKEAPKEELRARLGIVRDADLRMFLTLKTEHDESNS